MKTLSILYKSVLEQIRSYWVLLLTVSMGPFFIMVYYLIVETNTPHYDLMVINHDKGMAYNEQEVNHGELLIRFLTEELPDTFEAPFSVLEEKEEIIALGKLKQRKADALIVLPENFSGQIAKAENADSTSAGNVLFYGDLTNTYYLITAVWANEMLNSYTDYVTNKHKVIEIKEIAVGQSGKINDFDLMVPGILIVSIIMLMFTASIAFVVEVENKTIIRLKLSNMTGFQFLAGVSAVQLGVGLLSLMLTLLTAILLGFNYSGSLLIIVMIGLLTSLSIIGFSLIIAAFTRSANEVLVVGNFPLFLFMFFTGGAFPLEGKTLFTIAGYPINYQSLMSPTHAITALNKLLIMDMQLGDVIPEILVLILLTVVYFSAGLFFFQRRHLRLNG